MIRLKFTIDLRYAVADYASDCIFNIHAAQTRCQTVVSEALHVSQPVVPVIYTDPNCGTRYMRLKAEPGALAVRYDATDAADVSFATMFGTIKSYQPLIAIEAINDPANGFVLPRFSQEALSSHGDFSMVQ